MVVLPTRRWWILAVRGAAAILFGVLAWIAPSVGLYALVLFFGAYALVDGALSLVLAARSPGVGRWKPPAVQGAVGVVAGLLTLFWPAITALVLLFLIAAWAVISGIAQVVAAVRLREQIKGEWLLGLTGSLSIVLGVLLFMFPQAGALALVIWIGAFAVAFGALLVGLAFRVRAWGRTPQRQIPITGTPASV